MHIHAHIHTYTHIYKRMYEQIYVCAHIQPLRQLSNPSAALHITILTQPSTFLALKAVNPMYFRARIASLPPLSLAQCIAVCNAGRGIDPRKENDVVHGRQHDEYVLDVITCTAGTRCSVCRSICLGICL